LLKKHHLTLGAVESATGGLISHLITNISGSSDYYQGSITSYSNDIKIQLVGVKKETLDKYGAVSSQVAMEMAEGGRSVLKTDICIADTGIAGPTGAVKNKPIGLFYLGLAHKDGVYNRKHIFQGNREQNKTQAALTALKWLLEYLTDLNQITPETKILTRHVVTCFLESENKILILRRSSKVRSYQGRWAGISGYIETTDDEQALTEIREETGLSSQEIKLMSKGGQIQVLDEKLGINWIIHPYLFHVINPDRIKIDWEHEEFKWITPESIGKFNTVPELKKVLAALIQRK
jgi:nicotinamide-nucleotide amidase